MNNDIAKYINDIAITYRNRNIKKYNAYRYAAWILMNTNERFNSGEKAKYKLMGIGTRISHKITQYLLTINPIQTREILKLLEIPFVGPITAERLYNEGITMTNIMNHRDILTKQQKIGLIYMKDLNILIPRSETNIHNNYLKTILSNYDVMVLGGFYRGDLYSHNIDVAIISRDENVMKKIVTLLLNKHYIIDIFSLGKKRMLAVVKLNNLNYRRLDINIFPIRHLGMLYLIGNANNTIMMRNEAKEKNMKLTDKEFTLPTNSDRDVYRLLSLQYKKPKNRL